MASTENTNTVSSNQAGSLPEQNALPELTAKEEQKWKELGFCEDFVTTHPECVKFLLSTRLAFSLVTLHNTFGKGEEGPIIADFDGHPMIKMEGKWTRWEEIDKILEFDPDQDALIARGQPAIGYNYIYPDGIIPQHHSHYEKLYPVGLLKQDTLDEVRKNAAQYFETNTDIDPGQTKDCVIQIVTTKRDFCPRNWFTENVLDNAFEHTSIRLIDNEGKVYSFSFKMSPFQAGKIFENIPFTFLRTTVTRVSTPDYEETRKFDERRVTSVPLTSLRKDQILEFINTINEGDIRFNYVKQNCAKLTQIVLGIAGVKVNAQITFGDLFWRMLPSPSKLPAVGVVFRLANKVVEAVRWFFDFLVNLIPEPIKDFGRWTIDILLFLPRKLQAALTNSLALIFGASQNASADPPTNEQVENIENNQLSHFNCLIDNVKDFFDDQKTDAYYSGLIVDWQLQQKSTALHTYDVPRFYI